MACNDVGIKRCCETAMMNSALIGALIYTLAIQESVGVTFLDSSDLGRISYSMSKSPYVVRWRISPTAKFPDSTLLMSKNKRIRETLK